MYSRATVVFKGKVQGVFFRANTERKAIELNITGCVMNRPDSSVEAIFEGQKDQIRKCIDWCSKHQPYAKVNDMNVTWEEYQNEFDEFRIKHF